MIFAKSAIFQKAAHFSFVLVIIKLYSGKICKLKIPTKTEKFQNKVIFVPVGCTAGSLHLKLIQNYTKLIIQVLCVFRISN